MHHHSLNPTDLPGKTKVLKYILMAGKSSKSFQLHNLCRQA